MMADERTVRQTLLNTWREARRANLSFPHGREMTQEQMDEQQRLQGEQEKTRLALDEFDTARTQRGIQTMSFRSVLIRGTRP
jgi:hypothetical protein